MRVAAGAAVTFVQPNPPPGHQVNLSIVRPDWSIVSAAPPDGIVMNTRCGAMLPAVPIVGPCIAV